MRIQYLAALGALSLLTASRAASAQSASYAIDVEASARKRGVSVAHSATA